MIISHHLWKRRNHTGNGYFLYDFTGALGLCEADLSYLHELATQESSSMHAAKILSRREIALVFAELRRKRRSINTRQNAIIFRLAVCGGLRVSEIVGLTLNNVRTGGDRPHIYVPAAIAKRRKRRSIALWWDAATLAALTAWKDERKGQGATQADPLVCSQARCTLGKRLSVRNAQARWKGATKILGTERQATLSIHCGRHSFCSHALAGGRSLAEVRDAAGHANVATTSIYLHAVVDDGEGVGNLFAFAS